MHVELKTLKKVYVQDSEKYTYKYLDFQTLAQEAPKALGLSCMPIERLLSGGGY